MKTLSLFAFFLTCAWCQPAQPPVPAAPPAPPEKGDTVIAIFDDGAKMTLDEYRTLVTAVPQTYVQAAQQDREKFLHYYALMRTLSRMSEQEKLDQRSPNKESLTFARTEAMANIKYKDLMDSTTATPEEVEKYYKEHQEVFKQVKVSAIYVAFVDAAEAAASGANASTAASRVTKKGLSEEEAKTKAARLVAEVRSGGDFKKLVKENSDDETSRDKDGDFGTWKITDNVPDLMRPVVFGLKQGEVGEPVRQAHGFYIFHADEVTFAPLAQVRDGIFDQLKRQHATEWMQKLDASTMVQFPKAGAPTPPPVVKKQ